MNGLIADAALVHGSGVSMDGSSHPVASALSREQAVKGVQLLEDGVVNHLILCGLGPVTGEYALSEAKAMSDVAVNLGAPEEKLTLEEMSVSTVGNWVFGAKAAKNEGVEAILGVSRPSHRHRAAVCGRFVTKRVGLELKGYQTSQENTQFSSIVREIGQSAALAYFLLRHKNDQLAELPDLYEDFKASFGANIVKSKRYSDPKNEQEKYSL